MNIAFMGTPDFAKKSLEKIIESNKFNIKAVITNEDRPKGRGQVLTASPVKELAIKNSINVLQPKSLKNNNELEEELKNMKLDLIVVVAYGKILPKNILDIPKKGCINLHGSILPKYRGAAPIQWALINGDKTTGVTTMYMNEKMDEGDILLQKEITIEEYDNTGTLFEKLANIGADLLVETLEKIEKDEIKGIPQSGEPTYAPMIDKSLAKIDLEMEAKRINNLVKGLNPFLCCYMVINNKRYKIWESKEVYEIDIDYLKEKNETKMITDHIFIIDNRLFAKTSENFLEILEIQEEGRKRLKTASFLRGRAFD